MIEIGLGPIQYDRLPPAVRNGWAGAMTRGGWAGAIEEARNRYEPLLIELARVGTEVARNRVLKADDQFPLRQVVSRARHTFIFPPQQLNQVSTAPRVPHAGSKSPHWTPEQWHAHFDPSCVEGKLHIMYNDADKIIEMNIWPDGDFPGIPGAAREAARIAVSALAITQDVAKLN